MQHGPANGCFPKPSKTHLVIKIECCAASNEKFQGTGVQITEDGNALAHKAGQHHLGAAIGSLEFVATYLDEKVATWVEQVTYLADVASTPPHAAYGGFVFSLRHRWMFIQRTTPTAGDHMQPLNDVIDYKLMPSLVKHEVNDLELELMRLPARFGGMSFNDPVVDSGHKHANSIECTANLTQQILENGADLVQSIELDCKAKAAVRQRHEASLKVKADDLQRQCTVAQACKKGGSNMLTTIPVAEHGFFFDTKADFHDHVPFR